MGQVFLQYQGDGYAYVDNYNPVQGDLIHLVCVPDAGAQLLQIVATDSYDHSIAVLQTLDQYITFRSIWNNLYIEVYFSGSTPSTGIPIWLLKKAADNNNRTRI